MMAGLSDTFQVPECLSDVVSDLGRHNAAILRCHRAGSGAALSLLPPWHSVPPGISCHPGSSCLQPAAG